MKKVMIVEDEELILQGIRNIVDWEALGLRVVHMAHDGVEALEMWEREPVQIVVTDISMPEMDGLTLLREIRKREEQVRFIDSPEDPGGETPLPKAEDFSPEDKLAQEKEVTGMYLTGHPMAEYSAFYASGQYARTVEILESTEAGGGGKYRDGQRVSLLGIVTSVRRKDTKSGSTMAFVTLEDMYGSMAGLVFPRVLEEAGNLLFEGSVVEACGRLSFQEEKEPELLCEKILPPPKAGEEGKSARPGLYLRVESRDDPHYRKAMQYAAIFDGGPNDLYIYFKDQDKLLKAPAKYRVEVSDQLLKALLRLLGEGNCRFIGQRGRQNGGRGGALE